MQQVNLYQPILRKQERVFSLKTMLQGNLMVLAVLTLIYAGNYYQTYSLRSQHETLLQTSEERTQNLIALQKKFPAKKKDPALAERIKQKQALLNHRRRLISELQHQNTGAGGNPGFSEQLSGLARQNAAEVWLEQISVRDGKQLTLLGQATSPEEVPRLIQRLTSEPSFSGTSFSSVQITRDKENPSVIGFTMNTDSGDKEQ